MATKLQRRQHSPAMNSTSNERSRDPSSRGWANIKRNAGSVRRLATRSPGQNWLVVEAFITLWGAKAILRGLPFERVRRFLQRPGRGATPPPAVLVGDVVWAVDRVSRRWPTTLSCLPRAIAVHSILARRRFGSCLEIGVSKTESGGFEAHAWVELDGRVIIGQVPNLERFARVPLRK